METGEMQNGEIKKHIQRTADIHVSDELTFSKFLLSDRLLKTLNDLNFIKPSPIQLKVIPLAKCGLDMIIQAKSGTGKTLAFSICLLENYDGHLKFPQGLIIVPTREIAVQIVTVLNGLGKSLQHFKSCEFIGGTAFINDRSNIQTSKVVVGTPGRILHLIKSEVFNVTEIKTLVLDEADKLLEGGQMGKDVMSIIKLIKKKPQIIATTATVSDHLQQVMKHVMKNPVGITPKHEIPVLLGIKQYVKYLPYIGDNIELMNCKIDELQKIFTRITFKQCLLFTDSQSKTESYGNYLKKCGWKNEIINGAQDQSERLLVLNKLIKFKCRILITTDLMARGIDIENINLIINLDMPYDCFTYLHRIGRAGRFGTHGISITFVNGAHELTEFQKMLGDIGGDELKALRFPDDHIQHDFWNFKNKDEEESALGTYCGISKNRNDPDEDIIKNGRQDETVKENLALLQLTKLMISDKCQESNVFDTNGIINDYESHLMDVDNPNEKITVNGASSAVVQPENIFLKAIEDLNLYEDELAATEQPANTEPLKDERCVIFKSSAVEETEGSLLSECSTVSEYDSESSDHEDDFDDEPNPIPQGSNEIPCSPANNNSNFIWYQQYVANDYAKWQNIYHYQLAHIQNYLGANKK